jgi:hypothetical protein
LKTYAVILRDLDESTSGTTADTLHWLAFNIPGSASGIPEGLEPRDLPDGTRNGPGSDLATAIRRTILARAARFIITFSNFTPWIRSWIFLSLPAARKCSKRWTAT